MQLIPTFLYGHLSLTSRLNLRSMIISRPKWTTEIASFTLHYKFCRVLSPVIFCQITVNGVSGPGSSVKIVTRLQAG